MAIEKKEVLENTVSTEPVKQVDKDEVIKKLMEKIDNLEKTTGILMGATDKRLLNNYLGKNKKKLPSHVNLRVFNGKCIVEWKLIEDRVFKNPNTGIWSEIQTVELTCEDGEKIKTSLYDFEVNYDLEKFLVVESRTDDDTGDRELKIKSEIDGRELNINVKFVN